MNPSSHSRALISDAAGFLRQQMYFWGCDVRHAEGNLLLRYGMLRIERPAHQTEGSSRYRMPWREGVFELHGFCAGWYPQRAGERGVLFIRGKERLFECSAGVPLTPGHYEEERYSLADRDAMLALCRPMFEWVLAYEAWVEEVTVPGYRERCFNAFCALKNGTPWLPPQEALAWIGSFLDAPEKTPRVKRWKIGTGSGRFKDESKNDG